MNDTQRATLDKIIGSAKTHAEMFGNEDVLTVAVRKAHETLMEFFELTPQAAVAVITEYLDEKGWQ